MSGITVLLYKQALDKKQHNHESKGDYLKLILHLRHVFLQYDLCFCLKNCFKTCRIALIKVTLYDENHDFFIFYIFINSYCVAGDLLVAKSFILKY